MPHDEFEAMARLLEDALENVGENIQNSTTQTDEGEQVRTEPLQASAEILMGRKIAGLPKKYFSKPRSPANVDVTQPVTVASNVTIDDTMGVDGQSDSFPSPLHQASKPLEGEEAIPAYLKDGRKIRGLPRRGVQHATPCLPTKQDSAHLSPPLSPASAPSLPRTSVAAVAENLITAPTLHPPIVKKPVPASATLPIPPPIIAASIDMLQAPQPSLGMDIEATAIPLVTPQSSFLPESSLAQPALTDTFETNDDVHSYPPPSNPPQDFSMTPTTEATSVFLPKQLHVAVEMPIRYFESTNPDTVPDVTMAPPAVETVADAYHPATVTSYHAMDVKVDSSDAVCPSAPPNVLMTSPMANGTLPGEAPQALDIDMGNNDPGMVLMPLYAYRSQPPALPPSAPPATFVVEVDDNDSEDDELPGPCTSEFDLAMIELSAAMEVMRLSSLDDPEETIHYVHVPMESAGPTEDEVIEILLHPKDSVLSSETSPENAPIAAVVVPQDPVNTEENHSPSVTSPAKPSDSAAASLSAQEEDPVKVPNPSETASSRESGSINVPDVASTHASPGSTIKSSEPATPPETPLETCSFLAELAFMRQLGTIASTGLLSDRHVRGTFKELKEHFLRLGHPYRSTPGLNSIRTASGMTRDLLRKNGLRYDPNASKWHGPKGELGNNIQSSSSTTSSSPGLTTGSESGSDSSFDAPWVHSVEQSPLQPSAKTWKRNYNSLGLQV